MSRGEWFECKWHGWRGVGTVLIELNVQMWLSDKTNIASAAQTLSCTHAFTDLHSFAVLCNVNIVAQRSIVV